MDEFGSELLPIDDEDWEQEDEWAAAQIRESGIIEGPSSAALGSGGVGSAMDIP